MTSFHCIMQPFLYQLWYFVFSILGNYNYFFFAAHLLDVAVGVAALRIILEVNNNHSNNNNNNNNNNNYLFSIPGHHAQRQAAGADGDAVDHRRLHLHSHRVQLLQEVLRLGRGGGGHRPKVPRHAHGDYLQAHLDYVTQPCGIRWFRHVV